MNRHTFDYKQSSVRDDGEGVEEAEGRTRSDPLHCTLDRRVKHFDGANRLPVGPLH